MSLLRYPQPTISAVGLLNVTFGPNCAIYYVLHSNVNILKSLFLGLYGCVIVPCVKNVKKREDSGAQCNFGMQFCDKRLENFKTVQRYVK